MESAVAIDDGGDAVVRADLQKVRLELLALGNIDRVRGIGQPEFLEQNGNLAAVGRRPGVKIDHGQSFAGHPLNKRGLRALRRIVEHA
jgi:hypothetical protein